MSRYDLEFRRKISNTLKGHIVSQETRDKIRKSMQKHIAKLSAIHKGDLNPMKRKEVSQKVSRALKGMPPPKTAFKKGDPRLMGSNNSEWKGGITPVNEKIRRSPEYYLWRTAVLIRDKYICQICKQKNKHLHVDHIKPFSLYPELRLAIDNGRTLCVECHKQTDTWGSKIKTYVKN